LSAEIQAGLAREAQASLQEQQRIEAADSLSFEAFREHYLSPQRLVV
jgi:glutamate--cysteine ligase